MHRSLALVVALAVPAAVYADASAKVKGKKVSFARSLFKKGKDSVSLTLFQSADPTDIGSEVDADITGSLTPGKPSPIETSFIQWRTDDGDRNISSELGCHGKGTFTPSAPLGDHLKGKLALEVECDSDSKKEFGKFKIAGPVDAIVP